jgi:nucleoside-diphosphate-sugar epimerase
VSKGRILVTGATGFTGGHVCERLAEEGYAVRALVRDPARAEWLRDLGVELVRGDLCERASLDRAVEGVETVYHIGALYRPGGASRADMHAANVTGTQSLLEASIQAGVRRFVHCSTVGVHGDIQSPPANEGAPFGPGDDYQISKAEGERIVCRYMREGRLPVVIFRPAGIYGPRDTRFLKLFKAVYRRKFVMIGDGEVLYHFTYISDLVDGILLCGSHPGALGEIYILAGPCDTTLKNLIQSMADVLGVRLRGWRVPFWPVYWASAACEFTCKPLGLDPPLFRRRVDFFRKNRSFDISKACRELGYSPQVDLVEGLRRTADYYRRENLL